jgi:hypothetical protein
MLRTCKIAAIALSVALFGSLSAGAATVASQAGTVLISKGDGFAPIGAEAEIAAGGRVMVRPGGVALITYASDCSVRVGSGLWLIQEKSPCTNGTTLIDFTGRMNQQPPAQDPPQDPPPEEPPPAPGINPTVLVLGGVAIAGGVGLAIVLSQNSDNNPASP